ALARRRHAFDRQQLAADFGPGKACDRADLSFLVRLAVAELPHTRELGQVFGRDHHAFDLLFKDLTQALAREPRYFALERPDPGFARVVADEVAQAFFGQFKLTRSQPMGFDLLGDQVALRNLDLLVLGVSFEPDDFHAVEQRLRQVQRV